VARDKAAIYSSRGLFCVHMLRPDGSKGQRVSAHDHKEDADRKLKALNSGEPGSLSSGTARG